MLREGKADRRSRGLGSEFKVINDKLRNLLGGRVHWGLGIKHSRPCGVGGAVERLSRGLEMQAWHARGSESHPLRCVNWVWWCSVIPAFKKVEAGGLISQDHRPYLPTKLEKSKKGWERY